MRTKYIKSVQVMLDEETHTKMQRLIMMDALERDEPMKGMSAWCRDLIEDTVNFQINKSKIADYKGELIKQLKAK